jgi:hypothetical protein
LRFSCGLILLPRFSVALNGSTCRNCENAEQRIFASLFGTLPVIVKNLRFVKKLPDKQGKFPRECTPSLGCIRTVYFTESIDPYIARGMIEPQVLSLGMLVAWLLTSSRNHLNPAFEDSVCLQGIPGETNPGNRFRAEATHTLRSCVNFNGCDEADHSIMCRYVSNAAVSSRLDGVI